MSLETATYINQLNALNPDGATDLVSTADDHLRLIKSTIQNTFPNITGATSSTQNDISSTQYLVDTGTKNAVVVTPNPSWSAYSDGLGFTFKAAVTSDATVTIQANALAATTLVSADGTNPSIIAGAIYTVRYIGSNFQLVGDHSSSFKSAISSVYGTALGINTQLSIAPQSGTTNGLGRGSQILLGSTFNNSWTSGTDFAAKYGSSIQYIPNETTTAARNHRLSFSTSSSSTDTPVERMSILTDGNIGVGTTTPTGLFEIGGDLKIQQRNTANSGIAMVANTTNSNRIEFGIVNSSTTNIRATTKITQDIISNTEGAEATNFNIQTWKFGTLTVGSQSYIITGAIWASSSLKVNFAGTTTLNTGTSITLSGMNPSAYNGTYTVIASPASGSGYFYVTSIDNGKAVGTLINRLMVNYDGGIQIGNTDDSIGLGMAPSVGNGGYSVVAPATSLKPFRLANGSEYLNAYLSSGTAYFSSPDIIRLSSSTMGTILDVGVNSTYPVQFSSAVSSIGDFVSGGLSWTTSTGSFIGKNTLRGRVYFAGGATPTVFSTYNGSLSRNSVGDYTFTFANTLPTAPQFIVGNIVLSTVLNNQYLLYTYSRLSTSAVSFRIINSAGSPVDTPDYIEVGFF